ncbi:hypothetical protein DM2_1485 [Halorubrum sp. DM2]|uniref:HalOD1 output domain-containing protein n=1 Tax=Halorubrum sp. DM2 TaxID=2527867 RepID=UPI0024B792E1|nr:HalOD1 output domain-containing protein [Halorubrum sp. DM2]VTT88151.1 hypothetical protein DM2_1485 [Halorubrum sp. DM2]
MTDVDQIGSEFGAGSADEHRATYDWALTAPSAGVVETVADATNRGPLTLPQLYDSVDPDALDSLFRSGDRAVSVSFAFADCEVSVGGDGEVVVRRIGPDPGQ